MQAQLLAQEIGISFQVFKTWLDRYGYFQVQPQEILATSIIKEARRYFQRKQFEIHSKFLQKDQGHDASHLNLEIQNLKEKLNQLQSDQKALKTNIDQKKQEIQYLQDQNHHLDQFNHSLQQMLSQKDKDIEELFRKCEQTISFCEKSKQNEDSLRKRVFELERQNRIPAQQKILETIRQVCPQQEPLEIFRDILEYKETAQSLLDHIAMVNMDGLRQIFETQLQFCCVHPLCRQTTILERKAPIKVNHERECQVCKGNEDLRWFRRMHIECKRSNIKSFLLIGGDEIHDTLRQYSEQSSIEIRTIPKNEEAYISRVETRLMTYHILILWSPQLYDQPNDVAYEQICRQFGGQLIRINAPQVNIKDFCKQILYALNRGIAKV